jgi:hypothetical protein
MLEVHRGRRLRQWSGKGEIHVASGSVQRQKILTVIAKIVAMGTLTKANPKARELVTEIIDMTRWWSTLRLIVEFLQSKRVDTVRVEYGVVLDRDLAGKPQAPSRTVQLADLSEVIKKGFEDGTIEWAKTSDFLFHPFGTDLAFMLCNDADVHFASSDSLLLMELGHKIRDSGVKVYDSGKLI